MKKTNCAKCNNTGFDPFGFPCTACNSTTKPLSWETRIVFYAKEQERQSPKVVLL